MTIGEAGRVMNERDPADDALLGDRTNHQMGATL